MLSKSVRLCGGWKLGWYRYCSAWKVHGEASRNISTFGVEKVCKNKGKWCNFESIHDLGKEDTAKMTIVLGCILQALNDISDEVVDHSTSEMREFWCLLIVSICWCGCYSTRSRGSFRPSLRGIVFSFSENCGLAMGQLPGTSNWDFWVVEF